MRRILWVTAVLSIVSLRVAAASADDQADARKIVDKAIKATGGEEKLAKLKAQIVKDTGTYYGQGAGLPYTGIYSFQYPNQFRMEIADVFTIVVNGDKGWMKANGETAELDAEKIKVQHDDLYVSWLTTLLPLKDKQYKLATMGESKVNDRLAVGVRVSAEKRRDVTLFFDKETGLLVKEQHRGIAEEQGNKEVDQVAFFSEFKDFEGIKYPSKTLVTRDGEKYVESETTEYKAVGKLDDSVFGKP